MTTYETVKVVLDILGFTVIIISLIIELLLMIMNLEVKKITTSYAFWEMMR